MANKKVNFNGFTVINCKTMEGEDGYVLSCDLCLNGKKVAHCYDGGFGGGMDIYPYEGVSYTKLKNLVKTFRAPETDEEFGITIDFDVEQMVCELMDKEDLAKKIRSLNKTNCGYLEVEKNHNLCSAAYRFPLSWNDATVKNYFIMKIGKDVVKELKLYRKDTDLDINDKNVTMKDIAC